MGRVDPSPCLPDTLTGTTLRIPLGISHVSPLFVSPRAPGGCCQLPANGRLLRILDLSVAPGASAR